MTIMHIDSPTGLDVKLTAISIFLILPVALVLVTTVALVVRSRYLANVSLLESFRPITRMSDEL